MAASSSDGAPPCAQFLALRDAAALAGCHGSTIRRAADAGQLKVYRLPSGHRRFLRSDVVAWISSESEKKTAGVVALYARVSTNAQAKGIKKGDKDNDLARQIERLKETALLEYQCSNPLVYKDVLSGLNYQRKGLTSLLNDAINGKLNGATLLITQKDRLARFGTELIIYLLSQYEVTVVFTEKKDLEEKEELAEDLLAVIHHFSSKLYGSRSSGARKRTLEAPTIKRAKELLDEGYPLTVTLERMIDEGYKTKEGKALSYHILYKNVANNNILKAYLPSQEQSLSAQYASEKLERASDATCLPLAGLYQHFSRWCQEQGHKPLSKYKLCVDLKGFKRQKVRRETVFRGVRIKGENLHYEFKDRRRKMELLASLRAMFRTKRLPGGGGRAVVSRLAGVVCGGGRAGGPGAAVNRGGQNPGGGRGWRR